MRSAVRIATITGAWLALAIGSAASASADSATIKDKRNDVVFNYAVGGDRTAQEKSLAYAFDVKTAKFSLGAKYVSVRVGFASLRKDIDYRVQVNFSGHGAKPDRYEGFPKLIAFIRPGGTTGWTHGSNYHCGESDPAVAGLDEETHGGPAVTTTVKYGKDGYLYAQIPRKCVNMYGPRTIDRKASFSVINLSSIGGLFQEFVSSTKYKKSKWTDYVRGAPLKP